MNTNLIQVVELLDAGARVINHGGKWSTINGRKFPTKIVTLATHARFLTRKAKRDAKGAMDAIVEGTLTEVAAGSTSDNRVSETTTTTDGNV